MLKIDTVPRWWPENLPWIPLHWVIIFVTVFVLCRWGSRKLGRGAITAEMWVDALFFGAALSFFCFIYLGVDQDELLEQFPAGELFWKMEPLLFFATGASIGILLHKRTRWTLLLAAISWVLTLCFFVFAAQTHREFFHANVNSNLLSSDLT
jgi:hypothetical protein